ncbi:MAG: ATP-binding protein [bacterium]|nr:ATP-binding protein [bacterium]
MAQGSLMRQLIRAGAKSGDSEFREVAAKVIEEERAKRHHLLANDLERILYGEPEPSRRGVAVPLDVPVDRERGLPLLDVREPVRDLGDVVLSERNRRVLELLLQEQARAEELGSWGLRPMTRLLFHGPPGCGKTLGSEVLATELGLPFAVVRFDSVVSSFLGETAANLRKVLDFVAKERVVALFDEFDAIGKARDDATEHGELRRVVNAFLQMLDSYRGRSILIAATNHEQLLDVALLRRFDEVLTFGRPTVEQLRELLTIKLRSIRHSLNTTDDALRRRFDGLAHADVERILVRAMKAMVLQRSDDLTEALLDEAVDREKERRALFDRLAPDGG